MTERTFCDPEIVLDLIAKNIPAIEVARRLEVPGSTIRRIVHYARKKGDVRAGSKSIRKLARKFPKASASREYRDKRQELMAESNRIKRRIKLGHRFPGSAAELSAAIAASKIKPTVLPKGVGLGWKPSWMM